MMSIGEIDIFPNTGAHKIPYMLSRSQFGHHLMSLHFALFTINNDFTYSLKKE
jgi:hypothetical protein